jgi:hypothetical protein
MLRISGAASLPRIPISKKLRLILFEIGINRLPLSCQLLSKMPPIAAAATAGQK